MPEAWKTIVPEGPDVMEDWNIVGGKIYVNRLKDVKTETSVFTLDGKPAGKIDYDEIGSASGMVGRTTDRYGFFTFESFIRPPTIYRLDTTTGKREVFFQPKIPVRQQPVRTQAGAFANRRTGPGFPCSSPARRA